MATLGVLAGFIGICIIPIPSLLSSMKLRLDSVRFKILLDDSSFADEVD